MGTPSSFIPELVTELPTVANGGIVVNADGTETIRYQILEEAQWADGTPISGYDFEFTYQTIMDPAYPISRTTYEDIIPESVVAGDKTFEFTLAQPTLIAEADLRADLAEAPGRGHGLHGGLERHHVAVGRAVHLRYLEQGRIHSSGSQRQLLEDRPRHRAASCPTWMRSSSASFRTRPLWSTPGRRASWM